MTTSTKAAAGADAPPIFVEIFPEEMAAIAPESLARALKDERAPLATWCRAARLYVAIAREGAAVALLALAAEQVVGPDGPATAG